MNGAAAATAVSHVPYSSQGLGVDQVRQKSRDTGRARFIFNSERGAEMCTLHARTFSSEPTSSSGSSTAPESVSPLLLLGWPLEALREMDCSVGVLNFRM